MYSRAQKICLFFTPTHRGSCGAKTSSNSHRQRCLLRIGRKLNPLSILLKSPLFYFPDFLQHFACSLNSFMYAIFPAHLCPVICTNYEFFITKSNPPPPSNVLCCMNTLSSTQFITKHLQKNATNKQTQAT
jgi:hypothetical protein